MITTVVLAVKATPKALILIENRKNEKGVKELSRGETVKTTWKCYIPSFLTGLVSTGCLIGANRVGSRRNTALAAAYSLSESALKEYQEKVVEVIGEKKEQEVRDEIAKDRIARNPVVNKEVIITGKGDTLCLEPITSRYFKNDIETIRKIFNDLNNRMMREMYITANEYFYEIGLQPSESLNDLGWKVEDGLIEPIFSSQLAEDGTPCLVVDFRRRPTYLKK